VSERCYFTKLSWVEFSYFFVLLLLMSLYPLVVSGLYEYVSAMYSCFVSFYSVH
jgi:hypothetical protein